MARNPRQLCLLASVFLLAACDRSKLEGSVDGQDFGKVESAFFLQRTSSLEEWLLVLTNYPGGCLTYNSYFNEGSTPSEPLPLNALFVRFQLTEPVQEGEYEILSPEEVYSDWITWVHAWFRTYSETDGWTGPDAGDGFIDVLSADDALMTGTLEVTFDTGDTLSGTFHAEYCDAPL